MRQAYSISTRYQRSSDCASTELLDVIGALNSFDAWSRELGVDVRASFTDPALQRVHWDKVREFGKKYGFLGQLRRFVTREQVSPRSDLHNLINSADSVIGRRSDEFSNTEAFSAAALEMLDSNMNELFAHGRSAQHSLTISRWDESWSTYQATLGLYRYDDGILTIVLALYSLKAFEDSRLRDPGNAEIDKLVSRGRFERIS